MNLPRFIQHKYCSNLCIILTWLFCSGLYAANGQEISVNFEKTPPLKAFRSIEFSSPYRFIYNKELDLSNPLITLTKEDANIDEVLKEISVQTGLVFQRDGNNIAVKEGEKPISNTQDGVGVLSGKIVDDIGTPLPGAAIQIFPGNNYTITDNNGDFSVELPVGTYTVEISMMGFQRYRLEEVTIKKDETTPLNTFLTPATEALEEVMITARYDPETSSVEGLLLQQKKAAQFSDGISAEQISKTPDNNVGATLKRITGVTTVEEQYVVVRSMGDRWNQAVMDGVNLPSTDAYRQRFSFDIIPTALVESVVVSKTATPDMFSNFAGGQVAVKTKDIPRENFTTISVQTSYNDRSTFKDRVTKQQGDYDYLGFDDGTRDFPEVVPIPVPRTEAEAGPFLEQSRKFTEDNFTNYTDDTDPGSTYQLALGRNYKLENNNKWGFVAAASLRHTERTERIKHTERGLYMNNTLFEPATKDETMIGEPGVYKYNRFEQYGFKNSGASYNYNTTLAGMLNGGIQLGNHRLSIRNTYSHIYNNQLTQITGWDVYDDAIPDILNGSTLPDVYTTNYPVYQNFLQNKLEGTHQWGSIEVNWFAAHTYTSRDTKDATDMAGIEGKRGNDQILFYHIFNTSSTDFTRLNFYNEETDYNWGANIGWNFEVGSIRNLLKAGYFGSSKTAENQRQNLDLNAIGDDVSVGNYRTIYPPISEVLDGSNYNWGGYGWRLRDFYGDKYQGEVSIHSPFLMIDTKFNNWIRLVGGLRAEYFKYTQVSSQRDGDRYSEDIPDQLDDKKWQYLPSASLVLSPLKNTNIRLGYNKSVLRPKFAERLQTAYFDPVLNGKVLANANGLISSVSDNYDLKFEWFPSLGEILSLGVYHKQIQDPIEQVGTTGSDNSRFIYNVNSESAELWGIELEIRKNLSFLGEGKALNNLFLSGNASFNDTKVVIYETFDRSTDVTFEADRPLFGQTPYAYNLGIDYSGERLGFGVFHNVSGDQYLVTGADYIQEEIRMPYSTTDAQVRWRFLSEKNLELRCNFQNLFDSAYETYNNQNSYMGKETGSDIINPRARYELTAGASKTYDEGIDRVLYKSYIGRTFSLAIQYSF